jgi:predicted deacylase
MSEIKLDRIEKKDHRRTNGFIEYGKRPDYTDFLLPVIIVKGTEPGPTLLVDACTHGDEYEGAEAILQLAKELETMDFCGTFVGVPALNIEAFAGISRASMTDGMNLNRVFPGNLDTYVTQRLAATYMERVVKNADYVITFHGGGDVLHLEPICGYLPPDDDVSQKAYQMAKAFNIRYTWRMQNLPFTGVSALEYKKAYNIPTILPEVGSHCGRLHDREKNVAICYRGIKNVMSHLDMLKDWWEEPVKAMDTELHYIHAWNGGIQKLCRRENEIVEEGETLAVMYDLFGNQIEELKAPYRGVVIGFWSVPVIRPGDWWLLFAKILDEEK